MQAVMKTLDKNTKISFGAEMKHKHFTLLNLCLALYVKTPQLPIIAQTAYYYAKEKNGAIIDPCNDYILKPIKK